MKRKFANILFSTYDVVLIYINIFLSSARSRLSLGWQGCAVGKGFNTSGLCHFKAHEAGSIIIGAQVTLNAHWRTNRSGLANPVLLETIESGRINFGDFSGASAVVMSSRSKITIGQHVNIGANTQIFDHDFHSLNYRTRRNSLKNIKTAPVNIGDDVFIGTNSIILKGVNIGSKAIIGAGSVVTKNVPPGEAWAGNPAECIGEINGSK